MAQTSPHIWKVCSVFLLSAAFLIGIPHPVHAQGQVATPEQIEALRKKLEILQGQMAEVQRELQQLSAGSAKAPEKVVEPKMTADTEKQKSKEEVEARLTPKEEQIGKNTATYITYAQDPQAAPRINNEPLDPRFPGFFRLPGTDTLLRIGGYFKTDFIYDLRPAGNADSFIPSTIPIPTVTSVNNSTISVRPTRLDLDFLVPMGLSDSARFYIEVDFFGTNATTPHLRHAYGQAKNFLIGQTFSNFIDPDIGPDQLDFQGPNAWVVIRNPQFRYSHAFAKRTGFSFSAEKPTSDVVFSTPEFTAQPNTPTPDGTAKIRREMDGGHIQFSALFRSVAVYLPDGRHESTFGWGLNLAGAHTVFRKKDTVVYQAAYGHGIERYINDTSGLGIDAAITSPQNPHLNALPVVATFGAYQHFWKPRLRSSAMYGFVQIQNTAYEPGSAFHQSNYSAGNLIWNPFGSLTVGTEFLYGWRYTHAGVSGNAPRIMFSAKFNFIREQSKE